MDRYVLEDLIESVNGYEEPENLKNLITGKTDNESMVSILIYEKMLGYVKGELDIIRNNMLSRNRWEGYNCDFLYVVMMVISKLEITNLISNHALYTLEVLERYINHMESEEYDLQTLDLFELYFVSFINMLNDVRADNTLKKDRYKESNEIFNSWAPLVELEGVKDKERLITKSREILNIYKNYIQPVNRNNELTWE